MTRVTGGRGADRGRSTRWWVVLVAVMVSVSGCSTLVPYFFPTRPLDSAYVVNRDGHYFAGNRCTQGLAKVGVFLDDPYPHGLDEADFGVASWHAVAEPGVREVELFASGQPGVSVVSDDGQRPYSTAVVIGMLDKRGYWSSVWQVALDEFGEGMVNGMPEEEYWEMPDRDFGC